MTPPVVPFRMNFETNAPRWVGPLVIVPLSVPVAGLRMPVFIGMDCWAWPNS